MGTELKPIRTAADYERALVAFGRLWGAESGTAKGDRLDVLATLIDAYEAEHDPMDPPDPIEAIKFRMEQQGLSRKDLEVWIGTRTRVAEVLNGKRRLSIGMIRRLHEGLGIPAEILIRPLSHVGRPNGFIRVGAVSRTRAARGVAKSDAAGSRGHLGAKVTARSGGQSGKAR
jgi:HTH-type transcriptional regulator / antitoxin HigA